MHHKANVSERLDIMVKPSMVLVIIRYSALKAATIAISPETNTEDLIKLRNGTTAKEDAAPLAQVSETEETQISENGG